MPRGRLLIPAFSQPAPTGGWKSFDIKRLGDVTLIHGPESSGKTQALMSVCFSAQDDNRILFLNLGETPTGLIGEYPLAYQSISVDQSLATRLGINFDDLASMSDAEMLTLELIRVLTAFPARVIAYDNIDAACAGERWPIIWDFVFSQAEAHGTQILATSNDFDVISGLASAHERHPACSTTLVATKGNGHLRDHAVIGELHEFDTPSAMEIIA